MKKLKIHHLPAHAMRQFLRLESASGILLFGAAILALVINNSPWQSTYIALLNTPLNSYFKFLPITAPLLLVINEGLMTLFFLLVGLEIKREISEGELNTLPKIILPAAAAIGGMLIPAVIYVFCNWLQPAALRGWAIPTATDIAFSLGILALCGRRVPVSLKIFLTALAIFDDIGAITIIAIFYTASLSWLALLLAFLCLSVLLTFNYLGVKRLWPYLFIGILLWLSMLNSGIHATLAGIVLALTIPLQDKQPNLPSPLRRLENCLHPWVAFGVLPLFGLANAGISFANIQWQDWLNPITFGIIAGLFVGKPLGILGASWLMIKAGYAQLPKNADWQSLSGIALICGIGFTMSLFIGSLAFEINTHFNELARLGIFAGSALSGIVGYLILSRKKIT